MIQVTNTTEQAITLPSRNVIAPGAGYSCAAPSIDDTRRVDALINSGVLVQGLPRKKPKAEPVATE